MPNPVLIWALRIIALINSYPVHEDFSCLSPLQQALAFKHLEVISNWLATEGLKVDDLVAVLAVQERRTKPTYLFCFERGSAV